MTRSLRLKKKPQKVTDNPVKELMFQKRESFRGEIRKKNTEKLLTNKR